jgi:ABC-type transport system involved in multi-copper enzyme maturation permease subunit
MPHVPGETSHQDLIVAIVAALIVVGVVALGWKDITRFAFRRVQAIAGVSFRESIRRRVLWITPLAIIGVIAITQLTRPDDVQDAIRQTVRYCLFASGLIVVLSAILLACTNLPKEIESRVIFTIVTKPTTRLEIVLGKVIGFSLVTGAMLLIMGLFTFAYLEVRAWSMLQDVRAQLATMDQQDQTAPADRPTTGPTTAPAATSEAVAEALNRRIRRQTLQRYAQSGLLGTKAIVMPADLQVFGREPKPGDQRHWIPGTLQTYFSAPLVLSDDDIAKIQDLVLNKKQMAYLMVRLAVEPQKSPLPEDLRELEQGSNHPTEEAIGPRARANRMTYRPQITVTVQSRKTGAYLARNVLHISGGAGKPQNPLPIFDPAPGEVREYPVLLAAETPEKTLSVAPLAELLENSPLNVEVSGSTPTYNYGVGPSPVSLVIPNGNDFDHPLFRVDSSPEAYVDPNDEAAHDASKSGVRFLSRQGRTGMQLPGRLEANDPSEGIVAVYRFTGASDIQPQNGQVTFDTRLGVDRAGDLDPARNITTSNAEMTVRNLKTGFVSKPVLFEPQTGRLIDVTIPFEAVEGGDFEVMIHGRTPGQLLSIRGITASIPSITLVRADQSFIVNLFKSLLGLWLLSILVITISVFCSTFLSWPIAVVLTLLLLLGRWGVETLGDSLAPGGSRSVAQDIFRIRDPAKNKAVTDTMEALSTVLRNVGPVLPDVSRFPAFEDIDRGISMPPEKLFAGFLQLLMYGVPMLMLTYLVLRNKEVAP